jgi:hypothetical protein
MGAAKVTTYQRPDGMPGKQESAPGADSLARGGADPAGSGVTLIESIV